MSTVAAINLRDITANRPAASIAGRLFYDTTLSILQRDNGSSWDTLTLSNATSLATDTLWAAKGDLVAGTGSHTAGITSAGANGKVPTWDSSQTNGIKAAYTPGYEFDYVAMAAPVTVTGTAEGTETTLITGTNLAYDGATTVMIDLFCPRIDHLAGATGRAVVVDLYDGSTLIGRWGLIIADTTVSHAVPMFLSYRLTPTNASHQYIAKAWKTNAGDSVTFQGQGGGSGNDVPGFLRITKVA